MFEKEAEEYAQDMAKYYESAHGSIPSQFEKYLRKAVEFGYNKANEWHYPSKGEYPKVEGEYLVIFESDGTKYKGLESYYPDTKEWSTICKIIAWKEIVLPELPKEI